MASKHTPGPWHTVHHDEGYEVQSKTAYIADVYLQPKVSSDVVEANARLIATAPELLAALKRLLTDFGPEYLVPSICDARALINRLES